MKKMKEGFFLVSYIATLDGGVRMVWGDTTFTVEKPEDPKVFINEIRKHFINEVRKQMEDQELKFDRSPTIVNIVRLS